MGAARFFSINAAPKVSGRTPSGLTRVCKILQRCRVRKQFAFSQPGPDTSAWIVWPDQPVNRESPSRSARRPPVGPCIPTQALDETDPIIMTLREEPRSEVVVCLRALVPEDALLSKRLHDTIELWALD